MTGWFKFVLIGLVWVLSSWLSMPVALAVPVDQPIDMRSPVQSYGEGNTSVLTIAPELSNPDEIPLVEAPSESESVMAWLSEVLVMPEAAAAPEIDASIDRETVDATINQWLKSVQGFFESD